MPTIQYSKSPNVDTAFVVQDDGTKNRTLLVAPQDISTLELPENPNSTKGYVTVDGKKHRVVLTADISGSGGGGGVDESKVIVKSSTIPTADASSYRKMYIYAGETDATYTHGYIYECQKTSITYTGTVSFEAATLSGTTVTCSGDDFAAFLTEAGADPTPIVSGTMTYDAGANGWRLVGKDAEDNTVTSFIEYNEDYADRGFVFTGTPVDGDVIAFTCTVAEDTVTYGWVRLDVQPTPVVSVNGKTGTVVLDASDVGATSLSQPSVMPTLAVADWALDSQDNKYKQTKNVSGVTANNVVYVSPFPANADEYGQCNVLCITQGAGTLTFQADVVPSNALGVNVVILS